MKNNPQILRLALGGGAFRGTAHLGVLKALEEEGLRRLQTARIIG